MTLRVGLAVNPTAGRGRAAVAGRRAGQQLAAAGLAVEILTAGSAVELAGRIGDAVSTGLAGLVVVGGDGMVNLGVNAVAGGPVPLGIVPAGTGNDIARGLGLPFGNVPAAVEQIIRALDTSEHRVVDAARCTWAGGERWFSGVLAAGFDAIVNERANGWSWPRGRARYPLALGRELPVFRPRDYHLLLDGEPWHTRAMLIAIGNGPSYGGGMRVCPDARFEDGLLDVVVVEPISRLEFVRIFPRVYSGTHLSHPSVSVRRVQEVSVDAERIVGYADGERIAPLPLSCRAVLGALRLLAPVPAPEPSTGQAPGIRH